MHNTIIVAICDDDKEYLEMLFSETEEILNHYANDLKILHFNSADALYTYCKLRPVDIVLTDIDMPETDGFTLAERLNSLERTPKTVFITAHKEFSYQAYDYNPFCFVLKNDHKRLERVLSELIRLKSRSRTQKITLMSSNPPTMIDIPETVYLDASKNYVVAHLRNSSFFSFRATIKDVYNELRGYCFVLVQKGYIVNCRYIRIFNNSHIIMSDGTKKAMTRNEKMFNEAKNIYSEYMRSDDEFI